MAQGLWSNIRSIRWRRIEHSCFAGYKDLVATLRIASDAYCSASEEHQMMTYIKRTGRALMVALAIIVVEPAAAEAAKNPVMVNPKGEAVTNLKVTADSGTVSVVSTAPSGAMLDCEPSEGVGTLSTR